MADNVIRRDVVQIGFDIEESPVARINAAIAELRAIASGSVGAVESAFGGITQTAREASNGVEAVADSVAELGNGTPVQELEEEIEQVSSSARECEARISEMAKSLARTVAGKIRQLPTLIQSSASAAREFVASLKANAVSGLTRGVNKLKNGFQAIKNFKISNIADGLDRGLGSAVVSAKRLAQNLKSAVVTKISAGVEKLKNKFRGTTEEAANLPEEIDDSTRAIRDAANEAEGLKGKFGSIGKSLAKGLGGLAVAAGGAAVALGTTVVNSFGELEQNLGGSEAVFGKHASKIQTIAESAYKTMGTSQSDYLATANKMGALFQGSGIAQERSLELTSQAMTRAADMASVMGIDTQSALEAVTGAAKGNYEMMDNLGVAMNATTLEAYATAQGMGKAFEKMTQAEKAELAMKYFFENTEQYAGNFEREATETISGSFGLLSASAKSLVAGLGNADADVLKLTNNMVDAFQAVVKNIKPVLENLIKALPIATNALLDALGDLLPSLLTLFTSLFSQILQTLVGLIPKIIPALLSALQALLESLETILPTVIDAIVGIIPQVTGGLLGMLPLLITVGIELINNILIGLGQMIPEIISQIIEIIPQVIDALLTAIPTLLSAAVEVFTALVDAIPIIIDELVTMLPQIINMLQEFLVTNIPVILDAAITMFMAIIDALPVILDALIPALPAIIMAIVDFVIANVPVLIEAAITLLMALIDAIPQILPPLIQAIPQIISAIIQGLTPLGQKIGTLFRAAWAKVKEIWGSVKEWFSQNVTAPIVAKFNEMKAKFQFVWTAIKTAAVTVFTAVVTWINMKITQIKMFFTNLVTAVVTIFNNIRTAITNAITTVVTWIQGRIEAIKGFFSGLWLSVTTIFSNVVSFFSEKFSAAVEAIKSVFGTVVGFFQGIWDNIKEMFTKIGTTIGNGIADAFATVVNAVIGFAENTINGFIRAINTAIGLINEIPGVEISTISELSIPRLAKGGIVDKPTIAEIGENGREAVVPLENNTEWLKSLAKYIPNGNYAADYNGSEKGSTTSYKEHNEYNTYSPHFELHMNGTSATDDNKRKVMGWFKEAMKEMFDDLDRDNEPIIEV